MKKFAGLIFVCLLFSPLSHASEVPKGEWVSAMKTVLPATFCGAERYFRQCFDVSAVECEETAASATRICLKDMDTQLPEVLHQPQDGTAWGTRKGQCAGGAYEAALASRKISSQRCNDPANWQ